MKHPYIIGAGGVASYLLPCLIKAFRPEKITIIDKDVLEHRNLDRQLFRIHQIGQNKAQALLNLMADLPDKGPTDQTWVVIHDWFTPTATIPDDVDAIICVADNHEARRNAIQAAYDRNIRCYLGGNEYFDAEAYVTWEEHNGTNLDPRVRYPAIATSHEGSPLRCQGEEQEIHPQLAIANYRCAGHIMHLLHVWERYLPSLGYDEAAEVKPYLPVQIYSGLTDQSISTTKDLT